MENFSDITSEIYEEEERKRKKMLERLKREQEEQKKVQEKLQVEREEKLEQVIEEDTKPIDGIVENEEPSPDEIIRQPEESEIDQNIEITEGTIHDNEISPERQEEIEKEIELIEEEVEQEIIQEEISSETNSSNSEENTDPQTEPAESISSELEQTIEQDVKKLENDIRAENGEDMETNDLLSTVESITPEDEVQDKETQIEVAKKKVQKRESGNEEPRMSPGKASELLEVARLDATTEATGEQDQPQVSETSDDEPTTTLKELLENPKPRAGLQPEDRVIDEPTSEEVQSSEYTDLGIPREAAEEEVPTSLDKPKPKNTESALESSETPTESDNSDSLEGGLDEKPKKTEKKKKQVEEPQAPEDNNSEEPKRKRKEHQKEAATDERVQNLDKGTQQRVSEEIAEASKEEMEPKPSKEKKKDKKKNKEKEEETTSSQAQSSPDVTDTPSAPMTTKPVVSAGTDKINRSVASSGVNDDYLTKDELVKELNKREKEETSDTIGGNGIIYWVLLYVPIFVVIFLIILCLVFNQENFVCEFIEKVVNTIRNFFGI